MHPAGLVGRSAGESEIISKQVSTGDNFGRSRARDAVYCIV